AVGGRMQVQALPDPVARLQRGRAGHLVEVQREAVRQHRDVDRLADLLGQPLADRTALLHQVEPGRRRPGQPQDADAQAVLAAVYVLGDQAAVFQRGHQPERGGLVHAQLDGDLGDPGLTLAGQDFEHGDGAVYRLHRRCLAPAVAHRATVWRTWQQLWSA